MVLATKRFTDEQLKSELRKNMGSLKKKSTNQQLPIQRRRPSMSERP